MRLMHLHERLSARGGAERHLLSLLKHQQGSYQTLLAVGFEDDSLAQDERQAVGPWLRVKGLARRGLRGRGEQAARRRLSQAMEDFAPDLIHVHNLMDPALLQLAASAAPTVMTVQDHRLFCPGRGKLTPGGPPCAPSPWARPAWPALTSPTTGGACWSSPSFAWPPLRACPG